MACAHDSALRGLWVGYTAPGRGDRQALAAFTVGLDQSVKRWRVEQEGGGCDGNWDGGVLVEEGGDSRPPASTQVQCPEDLAVLAADGKVVHVQRDCAAGDAIDWRAVQAAVLALS